MSNDPKDWFRILDLNPGASLDQVKSSYRVLAKVWHPDRFGHDPSLLRKSQEKMKQLNHAYQQLCTALAESADVGAFRNDIRTDPDRPYSRNRADQQTRSAPSDRPTPSPPMAAMAGGGDASVRITWSPVYGASSYNVKRSTVSGGPYTTIATGVAWTDYTDDSVANGTRYYYVISSLDGSKESDHSPELTTQPLAAPTAPTNLSASIDAVGNSVQLEWRQSPSPEIRWNMIYRSTADSPYMQVAQVSAGTSYADTHFSQETTCTYVVTAVNSNAQQSPHSNTATVQRE